MSKRIKKSKQTEKLKKDTTGSLSDDVKMSEILLKLAEPLLQKHGKNIEQIRGIMTLAMAAWNMSMLPKQNEQEVVSEMIKRGFPEQYSAGDVALFLETVYMLMNRRRELIPDIRRMITEIEVRNSATGFDLTAFYSPLLATPPGDS